MKKQNIDTKILAHTKWNCKYHIVFAPKYRRKVFFEEKRLGLCPKMKYPQFHGGIFIRLPLEGKLTDEAINT